MSQTAYNLNPAVAVEGMIADDSLAKIVPKLAQGAVRVGLLCAPGTDAQGAPSLTVADPNSANPGQVKAFVAAADASPLDESLYVGVPVYDSSRPPFDATNAYSDQDPVPVMRKGPIYVKPRAAGTPDTFVAPTQFADVYVWVNPTAPGVTDPVAGSFAVASNGGKCALLPRARWLSAGLQAAVAILELW